MAVITIPDQFIYVSSYFQNQFTFGSSDDELRICRYINNILNLFGKDVIISGGIVSNTSIVGNTISISVTSGKAIQDKTLIPFSEFTLDIDITGYTGVGAYVVIYSEFEYTEDNRDVVVDPATFYFRIGIVDSTGDLIGKVWNTDKNKILLCAYDIDAGIYRESLTIEGNYLSFLGLDGNSDYFDVVDGGQL